MAPHAVTKLLIHASGKHYRPQHSSQLGMMTQACTPRILALREAEAGALEVQGQVWLYSMTSQNQETNQ